MRITIDLCMHSGRGTSLRMSQEAPQYISEKGNRNPTFARLEIVWLAEPTASSFSSRQNLS